ncbi:MAG: RsmE family RNA methyltransferase [Acidimicrobiales bacterium]
MHPADHPGPLVFVDDLDHPTLSDHDRHHLVRVLRARSGTALTVADGAGRWRTAVLGDDLETTGDIVTAPAAAPQLGVGFALVKGDKPELIVQKLTELGIDHIHLFRSQRSVVRWDGAQAGKAIGRLRLVARNAAVQCHRPRLPVVHDVVDLAALAATGGVALADRDGHAPGLQHPTILVGPEGGWSPDERSLGLPRVALGANVLRSETAAVASGVLLSALRAKIVVISPKSATECG